MIYFLHQKGGGPIKIGTSEDPSKRRKSIQSLFPYPVEVICEIEGGRFGEAFLHCCFRPISTSCEWFEAHPAIWRFILDAIDNGPPAFMPDEECLSGEALNKRAITEFGSSARALEACGWGSRTPSNNPLLNVTLLSSKAQGRLEFFIAARRGILPSYIADLHAHDGLIAAPERQPA